ncbi:MAG: hypothetical protein FWC40_08200 [Proteobacteria bacterium]|nr:hypothetical protein [Pseudomonadota bacterium]
MNSSKRIMLGLGIVIVIVFVWLAISGRDSSKSSLHFEPLDAQLALLERVYPVWFGPPVDVLEDEGGVRVVCDWFVLQSLASSPGEGWTEALEAFHANSMDYAVSRGVGTNYWAGEAAFALLEAMLKGDGGRQRVLDLCAAHAPALSAKIDNNVAAFRALGEAEALLDASGALRADKRSIARLLHRHIWVEISRGQFPIERIQPPEERMAMFRWQVEVSQMPLDRKLAQLRRFEAAAPHGYDYAYAAAVLWYNRGEYAHACHAINSALNDVSVLDERTVQMYRNVIAKIKQADASACVQRDPLVAEP